jgi:hypothetical protein
VIECSLIDFIPELGHTLVPLIWLFGLTTLKVRVASNHSVVPSGYDSVLPCHGSVLLSLLFRQLNCKCVYALLHWGLLLVSASRYLAKVRRMSNLSALTFLSASQSCFKDPFSLSSCH